MSDSFLDRPGARLAYAVSGPDQAERTLVSAHGLTSSRANEDASGVFDWSAVASGGARLVRYDARGHGVSTGRAEPDDYRWEHLAEDLLALVDAVQPEQPVDALGVSMGVGTLLWAALQRPERFRRIVLVIPPTAWATRSGQAAVYESSARFLEERGLAAFSKGLASMPPHPVLQAGGWWPLPDADVREELLPSIFRGAARTDLPAAETLRDLAHEVLLLPWSDDPGHPVSTADRLAAVLPNATLEVARTPEAISGWGSRISRFLSD